MYERVGYEEGMEAAQCRLLVSSAFTLWQVEGDDKRRKFVINFKLQSRHWSKGSIKMGMLHSFAMQMQGGDTLMSWDIKSGYNHIQLHPRMREFFIFRRVLHLPIRQSLLLVHRPAVGVGPGCSLAHQAAAPACAAPA